MFVQSKEYKISILKMYSNLRRIHNMIKNTLKHSKDHRLDIPYINFYMFYKVTYTNFLISKRTIYKFMQVICHMSYFIKTKVFKIVF